MKIRFFTLLATILLSSFAGAQTYDTNTLTNGLVAWYPLNAGLIDAGPRNNNLRNYGTEFTNNRFGISNAAISLNKLTYLISERDLGVTNNTSRTISVWINILPQTPDFNTTIISFGVNETSAFSRLAFYYNNEVNKYTFRYDINGARSDFYTDGIFNKWHHLVYVYESNIGFSKYYLDGIYQWNTYSSYSVNNTSQTKDAPLTINNFTSYIVGNTGYNGGMSDLRIYNRALSSNEVAALYAMESTPPATPTTTDTFGSGTNQFGIDFVTIGNPGNSNDTTGYGGVPYSYRIGKYAISQNQIDAATRNGLQNVTAGAWSGDQPAANISWYEAAAYVNWLNISQGYRPAYNLTFTNGAWSMALWPTTPDTNGNVAWTLGGTNLFRNANCTYFLPSENEWYKAAYYDPTKNGGAGGYWLYPTGSDTAPTPAASGTTAGTAVYNQPLNQGPASVFQAGGLSSLGTMGQGANIFEWEEGASDGNNDISAEARGLRGGYWYDGTDGLKSINRGSLYPDIQDWGSSFDFRVASVDDSWLTNGLVAWYSGGSTNDLSVNGNNLTSFNVTATNGISGELNASFYFSGSSSYLTGLFTNIPTGSADRTLSLWAKASSTSSTLEGLAAWGSNGDRNAFGIIAQNPNPNNLVYLVQTWGGGDDIWTGQVADQKWRHIVATYKGGELSAYIDSELKGTMPININTVSSPLTIGVGVEGNDFFQGSLSKIRIYSRALSSNEVAQLYALESTPPPVIAPTIATQPFDESISLGQNTSFTIEATGTGPFSYQWLKDGVALTTQTNTSLVITNAQSNAVGYYTCTVTDANSNSVTSSNAALNISGVPFWLWQGLVAYYQFNGDYLDASRNSNNLATVCDLSFTNNRFGNSGSAIIYGSTNSMAISESVCGITGNQSRSISFWLSMNNLTGDADIISFGDYPSTTYPWAGQQKACLINIDPSTGVLNFWGQVDNFNAQGPVVFHNSKWHNITFTYNGSLSGACFYLDGNAITNNNIFTYTDVLDTPNSHIRLGTRDLNASGCSFSIPGVSVDDVRIYSRALSSNEVASLYTLESTPPGPTNIQSISFPAIPTLTLTNGAYTLGATASSGLPVSYAIRDTNVATLTNGTLIPVGVGTTTIVASQAGDTNYLPATSATNTLVVTLAQQTVTPTTVATRTYGSLPFGLSLPTNSSGLPITPRIVSGPATLSGTNIILTGSGTVTVAYDAPGSSVYAAASVTNSFAVTNGPTNLKSQTITFKALPAKTYGSAPVSLAATVKSGLSITYWSSNTNVAVISGTNAVITGAGSTVITAYQPGDGTTYNPATPVSQTLQVNQAAQKLTLKAPKSAAYGSTPVAISATSTAGLPVTLTSSDPSIAMITNSGTNSLLVPTGVGTITLTASQAGTANVINAPAVGQPVVITPGAQTITFAPLSATTYGAAPITLSATSSAGLALTFSSSAAGIASISGNTLTIAGAGSAKITASQAGSKLWAPAKAITQSLAVAKAPQTISLSIPSSVTFTNGGLLPLTGTSSSGLPVAYKSGNAKVLFIQGTNCLISGRGTTTVVATQPGSGNYLAAPAITNTVTVQ